MHSTTLCSCWVKRTWVIATIHKLISNHHCSDLLLVQQIKHLSGTPPSSSAWSRRSCPPGSFLRFNASSQIPVPTVASPVCPALLSQYARLLVCDCADDRCLLRALRLRDNLCLCLQLSSCKRIVASTEFVESSVQQPSVCWQSELRATDFRAADFLHLSNLLAACFRGGQTVSSQCLACVRESRHQKQGVLDDKCSVIMQASFSSSTGLPSRLL